MQLTNFGQFKMMKNELSPKMVMVLNALNDEYFNPSVVEEKLINQALINGYVI